MRSASVGGGEGPSEEQVITPAEIYAAVPKAGAERAAQVWSFMRDLDPTEAAGRSVLAFWEWLCCQSLETRMAFLIKADEMAATIQARRHKVAK